MPLKNLNELATNSREVFSEYKKEEVILSNEFKKLYAESFREKDKISFGQYTTVVETGNALTITFPNQWFYIASYFVDFLNALKEYKKAYSEIFADEDNATGLIRDFKSSGEISDEIRAKIVDYFPDNTDKRYFIKFLTDYDWWFGSKTIDRGDYFVSPILNLANVVNVSQSYIADLTSRLAISPKLVEALRKSNISMVSPREEKGIVESFDINLFHEAVLNAGLNYDPLILTRFVSSLAAKPFLILTGLSGSGKTKLAQAFVQWICESDNQYTIVPVGADWTNREPLLGYPNALKASEYIKPDNRILDILIDANRNPNLPYFLILDEMNLSHVERYFADFLSVMESHEEIPLFPGETPTEEGIPPKLMVPMNFFIIGTVNIDETTYMFSPKVLDRSNTIEFRINTEEIRKFLHTMRKLEMSKLTAQGMHMGASFLEMAKNNSQEEMKEKMVEILGDFFDQLKKIGAEFGYRSAREILDLFYQLGQMDKELSFHKKLDIAIVQKLLPKLHGSSRRLGSILLSLGKLCVGGKEKDLEKMLLDYDEHKNDEDILYPISFEKISRMYKGAMHNGYASFAEA